MVLETAEEVTKATESLAYFLLLRTASKQSGQEVTLPEEIEPIAELLTKLPPVSDPKPWAELRIGRIALEKKKKGKRVSSVHKSAIWTDEINSELTRLVEDAAYRQEKCGNDGTRMGQPNFAAIARYLSVHFDSKSSGGSIKSHYYKMKGIDPPATQRKRPSNGEGTSAKKQRSGSDTESTETEPSSPPGPVTDEKKQMLVKLVEDESYRKKVLGKRKLKWQKIVEKLNIKGMEKKDLKKLYTATTGKDIPKD